MFIKLTRIDNSPIWINADFIVTVEPRQKGGATVVPIGDGLDYDVREAPEAVLAMVAGAASPAPRVVPVPAPKGLAPTHDDVSPETEPPEEVLASAPAAAPTVAAEPADAAAELSADAAELPTDAAASLDVFAAAKAPARRSRTAKAKAGEAAAKSVRKPRTKAAKAAGESLTDEQVERLKRMAPSSQKKLENTLTSQFKVADAAAVAAELAARGVLSMERDHVVWR